MGTGKTQKAHSRCPAEDRGKMDGPRDCCWADLGAWVATNSRASGDLFKAAAPPRPPPHSRPPFLALRHTHVLTIHADTCTHRAPAACVGFVSFLGSLFCCLGIHVSQMTLWVHPVLGSKEQLGARSPQAALAWRSLTGGPLPGSGFLEPHAGRRPA